MKTTHYFNTGVRPHSVTNWRLSKGHVVKGGTEQVPFECEDVPERATLMFLCDSPDLRESKLDNVIVREVLPGSAMLSRYAYFRTP